MTCQSISSSSHRAIGLDLMRISLALLIFAFHSRIHVLQCDYGLLNGFIDMGAIAMTGFFLLSGYALHLSYGKKDMSDIPSIRKFYIKRLIAILPLYYTWAIIKVVLHIFEKGTAAAIEETVLLPVESLGMQSWFATLFPFSHNSGSWFISCIMVCYFVFPLLDHLTRHLKQGSKKVLIVILSAVLLYSPFVQHYFDLPSLYDNPFFRVLEFTVGILVCQLNLSQSDSSRVIAMLRKHQIGLMSVICLVVGVMAARHFRLPADYMMYNCVALPCFVSLLFSLGHHKFTLLAGWKVIPYLSGLSFPFYLSQIAAVWSGVQYGLSYTGWDNNVMRILVSAFLCFGLANIFRYAIDCPIGKYLKAKLLKE